MSDGPVVALALRGMEVYIPSLIKLESYCRNQGHGDYIEGIAKAFGEFIEQEYPGHGFDGLGTKFQTFVHRVYSLDFLIRSTRYSEDWEPKTKMETFFVDVFQYFLSKNILPDVLGKLYK